MSYGAVKTAMRYKKYRVAITMNILSYLDLTGRAKYSREDKLWRLTEEGLK